MKTVKEVSDLTGVSVRTLHHYDAIGLLKPAKVTQAGYRLYGQPELERLYLILMYRELGLSLKDIQAVLDAPDFDRNQVLDQQILLMKQKVARLRNRIHLAKAIQLTGVKDMYFEEWNPKEQEEYSRQAKALYGKTEAYGEYTRKSKGRTPQREQELGNRVMDFFRRLGAMRPCAPDAPEAQAWAKELQEFFTEHYYTCTPQILRSLAESYACGGSMTENIDKAGGEGTGAFARDVIACYTNSL